MEAEPTTLQEAIFYFANPVNCREYLVARRWPNGVTCPRCGSSNVLLLEKYNRWHCRERHQAPQFTLKTGTIMEDSPLGLDKWMTAMWQIVNCKNGISSYEVHRAIGITQKSAWFLDHRIRLALHEGSFDRDILKGEVEADETFIGGKARNMHAWKKAQKFGGGRGEGGKTIVAAVLERGGKVRTKVIDQRRKRQLHELVKQNVQPGSNLYTDELKSYDGLDKSYVHETVNHAEEYVRGNVHTNNAENFWSLLKRGINGTYISVEPFHLFRYLDEQAFRYNNRNDIDDAARFDLAVRNIVGKRLTWDRLTGKQPDMMEASPY